MFGPHDKISAPTLQVPTLNLSSCKFSTNEFTHIHRSLSVDDSQKPYFQKPRHTTQKTVSNQYLVTITTELILTERVLVIQSEDQRIKPADQLYHSTQSSTHSSNSILLLSISNSPFEYEE
jgi:hypothetical protein